MTDIDVHIYKIDKSQRGRVSNYMYYVKYKRNVIAKFIVGSLTSLIYLPQNTEYYMEASPLTLTRKKSLVLFVITLSNPLISKGKKISFHMKL